MELDSNFSSIYVCPINGDRVKWDEMMHSHGVCHICGHDTKYSVTHATSAPGKWLRPSIFEWFRGDRKKFIKKEDLESQ